MRDAEKTLQCKIVYLEKSYKFQFKLFFISKSGFIFFAISQNLKTKFCVFWTQTCRKPKLIKFINFPSITHP